MSTVLAEDVGACAASLDDRSAAIGRALETLEVLDQQVVGVHGVLSQRVGGDRALEERLATLLSERADQHRRLGALIHQWVAAGGSITLDDPAPIADAIVAPIVAPSTPVDGDAATSRPGAPSAVAVEPSTPASRQSLELLRDVGVGGAAGVAPTVGAGSDAAQWIEGVLRTLRVAMPRSGDAALSSLETAVGAIGRLDGASRGDRTSVLTVIVARLRSLQERSSRGRTPRRVVTLLRHLTAYCRRSDVGYVHGLQSDAAPGAQGWDADADVAREGLQVREALTGPPQNPERLLSGLEALLASGPRDDELRDVLAHTIGVLRADDPRLVRMLGPHAGRLRGDRRLKGLRRAIRSASAADVSPPPTVGDRPDVGWSGWPWVRGRRVLLVGNKNNPQAATRLVRAFDLAQAEWLVVDPRRMAAAADRIRAGAWDLCILTRFRGHDSELLVRACEDAGTHWLRLDGGYGVANVQRHIDGVLARGVVARNGEDRT